jgi:hypothetical protein
MITTTIQDLRSKATAAELVLIERVTELVVADAVQKVKHAVLKFINANPPPSGEDCAFDRGRGERWFAALSKEVGVSP